MFIRWANFQFLRLTVDVILTKYGNTKRTVMILVSYVNQYVLKKDQISTLSTSIYELMM